MAEEVKQREDEVSSFEDLINLVGTNGWKNYLIIVAASLTSLVAALPLFSYQFLGKTPNHWCHVEELVKVNWTASQIREIAIPFTKSDDKYSNCELYALNYSSLAAQTFQTIQEEVIAGSVERNETIFCSSRDFEDHVETIVNAWDLVCERSNLYSATQAALQGGILIGSLITGFLLDRFGRKFIFRICITLAIFTGFITTLSPNIYVFILLRTCLAISNMGSYMASFVISMEICTTKQRSWVGSYIVIPWAFGMMLTAGIAYWVRPWKLLQVALTLPAFGLIWTCWILPESPRWLILKGRHEEALVILKSIAISNGKEPLSDTAFLQHMKIIEATGGSQEDAPLPSESLRAKFQRLTQQIFYVVLDSRFRAQTLGIFFCWFSVSLVYYGISLASSSLNTDPYLYIFLSGLIEIPAYILLWPTVEFLGRKKSLVAFYITCAFSILAVMTLVITDERQDYSMLRLILFLTGKVAITMAFQLIWMYTVEIFPTRFRSLIVGASSAVARVGSICSPFINDQLVNVSKWLPSALFGVVSVVAGIIASTLPETKGKNLPDAVDNCQKESR